MTRRVWAVLLALCLVLGSLWAPALAATEEDASAAFGVDAVVVLEMTNSMGQPNDTERNRNDRYGFRLDATAMLIGMMDMDGSRVAIVPFASEPVDVVELTAVTTTDSRESLIRQVYNLGNRLYPNTNIGAALMRANQILNSRDDKTNQPMIVLMTDGQNSLYAPITVRNSWRWENGQIINRGKETYTTDLANQVTKEAAECAGQLGFPIYTVALTQSLETTPAGGISLRDIALTTGLKDHGYAYVTRESAEQLPAFFARMLADKIGSSVQYTATPHKVEGLNDTYEVLIPIPNRSILETNIILPVKTSRGHSISAIDPGSIRVLDAQGALQSSTGGVTVMTNATRGHFAMVKIRRPQMEGLWKLQFTSDGSPADVTFNLLYNYDLRLTAAVQPEDRPAEYYKNETISLSARFTDAAGQPSQDTGLYADHADEEANEDWMTVRAWWELYHLDAAGVADTEPVLTGDLAADVYLARFEGAADLSAARPVSGSYRLEVHAQGAGLNRQVDIPLTILNHHPVAADMSHTVMVNGTAQGQEATWTVEGTSGALPWTAGDIVRDEDGDPLRFQLVPQGDGAQPADLTLAADGTLNFTTRLQGDRVESGAAVYRLSYTDGDLADPGQGEVLLTLNLRSDVEAMLAAYEPELILDGAAAGSDGSFLKNTPLTARLRLRRRDGQGWANGETLATLEREIHLVNPATGADLAAGGALTLEGDAWAFTLESTGNQAMTLEITGRIAPFDPITKTVTVPNAHGPEVKPTTNLTLYTGGSRVPGFLKALAGEDTPADAPERFFTPADFFTDADNDALTYDLPRVEEKNTADPMPEGDLRAVPAAENAPGEWMLEAGGARAGLFHPSYQGRLVLFATDGDGETAGCGRVITVVDVYARLLTRAVLGLLALAALVILALLVRQALKPRFPRLHMTIREEPSLYESASEPLSPVKTATNLNALGVDADMAAKHGLSLQLLQNIAVRPVRSDLAVAVSCRRPDPTHEVLLEGAELKPRKWLTWREGQELTVRARQGEGLVALRLEDRRQQEQLDAMADFGAADDWAEVDAGTGDARKAGQKHSRRVERRRAAEAADRQKQNPTDDFDF